MTILKQQINSFTASTIAQSFNTYSSSTTYTREADDSLTNASVAYYKGFYWRSVAIGNIGNEPSEESSWWAIHSVSNRNAMLDQESLTFSTSPDNIVVEFARGRIDTLAIGYVQAKEVTIEHIKDSVVLTSETRTYNIDGLFEQVDSWYTYVTASYDESTLNRHIKIDIKPLGDTIRVTFVKSGYTDEVSVGFLVGGEARSCGATLDEVSFNFGSFSNITTSAFGKIKINKRNVQNLNTFTTAIEKEKFMKLQRFVKENLDEIMVFIIDESDNSVFENMISLAKMNAPTMKAREHSLNYVDWSIFEAI